MPNLKSHPRLVAIALILVLGAATYRVLGGMYLTGLPNFSPAMAMALCSGIALTGIAAFALPLGALFVSDLLLNAHFGQPLLSPGMIGSYACYLIAILGGQLLRNRGLWPILGGTILSSLFFYLVTNSLSWWGNINYAQTGAGWAQALTVGQPGFPPTWVFFRNSLISDLIFAILFVGALAWARRPVTAPAAVRSHS